MRLCTHACAPAANSGSSGGAIKVTDATVTASGCLFVSNTAVSNGGAAYVDVRARARAQLRARLREPERLHVCLIYQNFPLNLTHARIFSSQPSFILFILDSTRTRH